MPIQSLRLHDGKTLSRVLSFALRPMYAGEDVLPTHGALSDTMS